MSDEAKSEAKYEKTDGLLLRLSRAQEEVRLITQDVEVQMASGGYKGISAAQVVALAKRVLHDNGIVFFPKQDQASYRVEGNMRMIWVDIQLHCIDKPISDPDHLSIGSWGEGADRSDKGLSKAFTNANKNVLAKILQMTTYDDAEGDHEGIAKDGTDGKTKGDKSSSKGATKLTPEESDKLRAKIFKALPHAPMTPDQGEKFATENGADIARLLPADADLVRKEFASRRKKK